MQLSAIEGRIVDQQRELRALGESTEKVAAQLKRLQAGGTALGPAAGGLGPGRYADVKLLHPELPNAFVEKRTHWPPAGANTEGQLAVDWFTGDPKGFNRVIESSADLNDKLHQYVACQLGSQSGWTDPDTYYGEMAWRLEVADDYKEYTFYLRKGIKWHALSGVDVTSERYRWLAGEHEVTAHDFVFQLNMLLHPQVQNGSWKNYYVELESFRALDDYTFQVRWKKKQAINTLYSMIWAVPRFLYEYEEDGTKIPEATLGLRFNQHWYNNRGMPGCGPYRFAEYVPGSHMLLERNEHFYGELPALKTIRYPIYSDRNQTVLKLKSGELTFGEMLPGFYREEVLKYRDVPPEQRPKGNPFTNGQLVCEEAQRPIYRYLGWNADTPYFSDKRVRRAMTHAVRREAAISSIWSGLATITTGPYPPGTDYWAPEVEPWPFDLKEAAKLLAEAGWVDSDGDGLLDKQLEDGKRIPFEFSIMVYSHRPEFISLANIIREDLLSIGVRMKVEPLEWSLYLKRLEEKNFEAFTGGWALVWLTDLYQIWHSSQADAPKGSNRVGFRNARADELIEQLRVTIEKEPRKKILQEFHRIVHEEQPYTFLFTEKTPYCHSKDLRNVTYAKIRPIANVLPWWSAAGRH